ncbi:MAG: TIGR01777 family oxidoreductase [Limisphaerales bacterium]
MRLLITGANGMIGQALERFLSTRGHEVCCLVRRPRPKGPASSPPSQDYVWDPDKGHIDRAALENLDGIIHLAGANIAQGRWTAHRKQILRSSRVATTQLLVDALRRQSKQPSFFIGASAVGIYGDRASEEIFEDQEADDDFLGRLGQDWEAASAPLAECGMRVVHLRLGMVLAGEGGALKSMLPAFRFGMGAILGHGDQYVSWISMTDLLGCVDHIMHKADLEGPFNLTAPNPVTFKAFAKTLGKVLKRPVLLRLPSFAVRLLFGEMGQSVLLSSCRALPGRLLASGFEFQQPDLEPALKACIHHGSR